jgi:hypothetical protein
MVESAKQMKFIDAVATGVRMDALSRDIPGAKPAPP